MVWEPLARFLGIKKSEGAGREDILARMGLWVIKDERLENRVKRLNEFYVIMRNINGLRLDVNKRAPEEILEDLIQQLNELNELIDAVATPYWRGLSTPQAGVVMRAWSLIHAYVANWASALLEWFKRIEEGKISETAKPMRPKEELVSALLEIVMMDYAPRALTLLKNSWSDLDITPSWAGVVQPQLGYGGGSPIPTYDTGSPARRTSSQEEVENETPPFDETPGVVRRKKEVS